MPSLVALEMTGRRFVEALTRVWAAGDAVLAVDSRLPAPARQALLEALRPTWVIQRDGARRRRPGDRPVEPGDALVVATSGTTGEPKGVVLTHEALAASAWATTRRLSLDPATDHWLACLPPAHIGGLSVITRSLITGTALTVHDHFDSVAVDGAPKAAGATAVSLVNTALMRIDPARWRVILLGGDSAPPQRPPNTVVTYGLTETGSGVVYDGSALPGVEVNIDANGQILLRAPMMGRALRTASGDVPLVSDDGWFATGDAGSLDDAARLSVFGRIADCIVSGAEKVWPITVERIVRRHPAVTDVAVLGIEDPEWGQRVVAVVVIGAGHNQPGLDEIRDLVSDELPSYAAPRQLVAVDALPRAALGKLRRPALVAQVERSAR